MRISAIAILLQIVLASAGALNAQTSGITVSVDSHADIYKSGGFDDGTGAASPLAYVFPAGPGQVLTLLAVVGQWTCNDPVEPPYSADGTTRVGVCYPRANLLPTGPFSGYDNTDYQGAMVGMFLECGLPMTTAPTLRFYVNDGSQGGIKTDFTVLQPAIGQVFFVGDGLTGTGSGTHQSFLVPPTATHLYLGYIDSCSSSGYSGPGCYFDNGGSITVSFAISQQARSGGTTRAPNSK
jgi:hypothetical protein